jgi:hypothetical protein
MNGLITTIQDAYRQLPESDWLRFAVMLLVLLSVLWLVRLVSRVNRYVLLGAVMMGALFLFANWVHNRNEPSFLTPVVDVVAPWFPKKVRSIDV